MLLSTLVVSTFMVFLKKPPTDELFWEMVRNITSDTGDTALVAARLAQIPASRLANQPILEHAARNGKIEIVKLLIEKGWSPDGLNHGAPLLQAITRNHADTVLYLLKVGATPSVTSEEVGSPLHFAAQNGNTTLVKALLDRGADIDTPRPKASNLPDRDKYIQMLPEELSLSEKRLKWSRLQDRAEQGLTPLMSATIHGQLNTVGILLDCGASIDAKTHSGKTALLYAEKYKFPDIVNVLKQYSRRFGGRGKRPTPPTHTLPTEPAPSKAE